MKALLRSLFIVFVSAAWIFPGDVFASHVSGGDLSYQCLGNNQYKITLNLFRDCSGIDMSGSETIEFASSCSTFTVSASLVNIGGTEISQLCEEQTPNSTCNGGGLPGMERYTYEATVTMPPCTDWVINWSTCCRNTTINVPTSSGDGSYIEATMNSTLDSCNNSPYFTAQPIPYVCANQQVIYNWGVTEMDGDSLTYSFIAARNDLGTDLTYQAPYSATNPINGIAIDQFTGQIVFTPTTVGNFIVAVLVNEYDSAGNLLGTTLRDIQFVVQTCSNIPPPANQGQITNLTGTANQTGAYALELCDGGSFTFEISIADTNSNDTITLTTNVTTVLPGSSFTTSGTNPVTAVISWSPTGGSAFFNYFTVFANDGACPVAGIQSYVYQVSVIPGTVASPDTTVLCGPQIVQLNAIGGNNFVWTAISGDPIVVGTNFSCDSCPNPVASPAVTTFYEVVSDLTTSTCVNRDTIQVKVVPDFTYIKSQTDSAICLNEQVQFQVVPDSTSTSYSYDWTPAGDTVANPVVTFITSGTRTVYFEVTSLEGCAKTDSMQVLVSTAQKPEITVFGDTTICAGDSSQLSALNGCPVPASCGLSTEPCPLLASQITVGTGNSTLGNTTYPAPYGHWYMGARHQLLFTAAELAAMGFQGGQITEMALNVASISGTTVYNNFEIKMGCSSITSLSSWQSGLFTVFPAQTVNITTGWNTHTFTNAYSWDGVSNIIIEICFNNQPASYTYNSSTYYTATSFPSVIWYNADVNPSVCTSTSNNSYSPNNTYRPNVRFSVKGGLPSGTFTYSWSPTIGLNDATIFNPWAAPPSDTSYTVTVTDTIGGCSDTASIFVNVVPSFTYTKSQNDSSVCKGETVLFTVSPDSASPPYSIDWSSITGVTFSNNTVFTPTGTFNASGNVPVYFTISNSGGCDKSDSMFVLVSTAIKPVVMINADTTICAGDSTQVDLVNNSSSSTCNYVLSMYDSWGDGWNGAMLSFFSNGTLVGSYTLTTGDSSSVSIPVTDGATISITYLSGSFPSEESYILYDANGTVAFQDGPSPANGNVWTSAGDCPGGGFPNHSFTWSPNVWISDISVQNPLVFPQTDTSYTVIVYDTVGGCSDTASLNFNVAEPFTYTKSQSDTAICKNDSVLFNVVPDTGQTYAYQWTPATNLNNATIANPVAGPMTVSGNYTFYFTISNGCDVTDSMKVTVSNGILPVVTVSGNDSICPGGKTQLTAQSAGGNSPTYSYNWSPSATVSNSGIFNPVASPTTTTNYSVIVTDTIGNCADTATFNVTVLASPGNIIGFGVTGHDTIFPGCSVPLVAQSTGGNLPTFVFDWSPGTYLTDSTIYNPVATPGQTSTIYSVIVTDTVSNCKDTVFHTIKLFTPQINPLTDSVCLNDNFVLLTAIPSFPDSVTWSGTGVTPNGYFAPSLAQVGAHNVFYSVKVDGCIGYDTLKINVYPNPAKPMAITDNPFCAYSLIDTILAITQGGNITWYSDSLLTDTLFYGNPLVDTRAESDSFDVWLTETSLMGCESNGSTRFTIEVIPNPQAGFTASPSQGFSPLSVNFTNSTQPGTVDFSWNFAGLSSSTSANPAYTFTSPGSYDVVLVATDSNGCADTTNLTIIVDEDTKLVIPNIFTPNGDGKNDAFKVQYVALSEYHITIFNRWGMKVYKSDDPAAGWDGKDMQGQLAQSGVYFYVIEAKDRNGNPITQEEVQGTVTLVRE